MDTLIGFVGDGYSMLVADTQASRSIVQFKDDEDKILALDSHKLVATAGPAGDRAHFTEFIQRNVAFYELRNSHKLSTHATVSYMRGQLAQALRSRGAYQVNMLVAGYDEGKGPSVYFMDHLAAMIKVEKSAHGYGSYFILSTLDRNWKPNMSVEEGLDLVRLCVKELETRFFLNTGGWKVKIADKDGTREIEL